MTTQPTQIPAPGVSLPPAAMAVPPGVLADSSAYPCGARSMRSTGAEEWAIQGRKRGRVVTVFAGASPRQPLPRMTS